MATDSDENDDVLDYRETPLNACSLETFCGGASQSIPLCLGCYQLNESTGKREGRLDLYSIPFDNTDQVLSSVSFGANPPLTVFGDDSENPAPGVLDGKWSNHAHTTEDAFRNYYATAHANGEIWVHDIASTETKFEAKLAGKSDSPSSSEGLCLALAWESPLYSSNNNSSTDQVLDTRIISSYSDGHAAIHRVRKLQNNEGDSGLEFELEHHWYSHKMFTVPAEVWCANFIDANTVVTGGDEGSWKVWDLRQPLLRPVHHGSDDFGAGVTVLSPHPQNAHTLAIGSYDETVAIFDLRQVGSPQNLYHSESLGGGIWRCKWHPFEANKLLVAAMHGGCVVGEFKGLDMASPSPEEATNIQFQIQNEFKLHKSMAYGIDWLSTRKGTKDAAASCSFYDKAMYLWKTNSSV